MSNNMYCYRCGDDISYDHNKMCESGCLWCWQCAEFQHKNYKGVICKGHDKKCKDYIDYEDIDRREQESRQYSYLCNTLNKNNG